MSIVDSLPVLMSPVNVFVKHIYCHAGTALFLFFILLFFLYPGAVHLFARDSEV